MRQNIWPAIRLTLVSFVFFSGFYTALMLGIAQIAPEKGQGEVIRANGKVYYKNIAQHFRSDKYFSSRPSAVGYNAAGSGGSNKGPTNPAYLAEVQARIDTFIAHNPGVKPGNIPSDLMTASGAGLDPHISVQAAVVQIKRIAAIRGSSELELLKLIEQHTERPLAGFFGTTKVHVLSLNLSLDQFFPTK